MEPQAHPKVSSINAAFDLAGETLKQLGSAIKEYGSRDLDRFGDILEAFGEYASGIGNALDADDFRDFAESFATDELVEYIIGIAFASAFAAIEPLIVGEAVLAIGVFVALNPVIGPFIVAAFALGGIASYVVASRWLADLFGNVIKAIDPLVLDLDGGGVSLTALAGSNVYFDLNNNNYAERTGWVSAGDGLLALDANHNGRIDNGTELR